MAVSRLLYGGQDDVIQDLSCRVHDSPSEAHDVMGQTRDVACHVHDVITTRVTLSLNLGRSH